MNKVLLVTGLFFMMIASTFNPILKTGDAICDENDCPPPPCGLFFEDCNIGENLVHCSYNKEHYEGEGEWGGHAWGTLRNFTSIEEATNHFNDSYAERMIQVQGAIDAGYDVTLFEDNPQGKLDWRVISSSTIDDKTRTDYESVILRKTQVLRVHAFVYNIPETEPKAACIFNELEKNFLEIMGSAATELNVKITLPNQNF